MLYYLFCSIVRHSTADKTQHNSLVVFCLAQLMYSRLRPFPDKGKEPKEPKATPSVVGDELIDSERQR